MQLELKDERGVMGTIKLPLEELKEELGLGNSSSEIAAHLKESLDLGSGSVARAQPNMIQEQVEKQLRANLKGMVKREWKAHRKELLMA